MKANLSKFLTEKPALPYDIVSFAVHDDTLDVIEECDQFFGVYMDATEVGRLIAWLQEAKAKMQTMTREQLVMRDAKTTVPDGGWE